MADIEQPKPAAFAIPDELKKLIGVPLKPRVFEVEKGQLKRFLETVGDDNPLWQTMVPPAFFSTFSALTNDDVTMVAEKYWKRRLNAGSEYEYFAPIHVGDVITSTTMLAEVNEKEGKRGAMFFVTREVTYKNQKGEKVAVRRSTFIWS